MGLGVVKVSRLLSVPRKGGVRTLESPPGNSDQASSTGSPRDEPVSVPLYGHCVNSGWSSGHSSGVGQLSSL